jgi:hypothetical protein
VRQNIAFSLWSQYVLDFVIFSFIEFDCVGITRHTLVT